MSDKCPKCPGCGAGPEVMNRGTSAECFEWWECDTPKEGLPSRRCLERQLAQSREREAEALSALGIVEGERDDEKARADKAEQGLCGASNDLILLRERTEKVEFDCESLRLELQAEKHNHQKDNEHLLARAEKAEADNKETRLRMDIRDRGNVAAMEEIARQAEKAEADAERLREAFRAAVFCPKGTLPKGYEDLWDGAWGGG